MQTLLNESMDKKKDPRQAEQPPAGVRPVIWLVIDGLGYELAKLLMEQEKTPVLAKIAQEGYLGALAPPAPCCQTPPALIGLFSGSEPPENGVWGFMMPDYTGELSESVSGFNVTPNRVEPIWDVFEKCGLEYTLVNAAFRRDPVWRNGRNAHLVYDGYRNKSRWVRMFKLNRGDARFSFCGVGLKAHRSKDGVALRKGGRILARLEPNEIATVRITRSLSVYAQLMCDDLLFLYPHHTAYVAAPGLSHDKDGIPMPEDLADSVAFRFVRNNAVFGSDAVCRIPLETESAIADMVIDSVGEIALETMTASISATAASASALSIYYFSPLDDICHAYMDQIQESWPDGRGARLVRRSMERIGSYIRSVMEKMPRNGLLILTGDHGQVSYRRRLHINELFERRGLIGSRGHALDFKRATAYYHPSNCGQVVVNPARAQRAYGDAGAADARATDIDSHAARASDRQSEAYVAATLPTETRTLLLRVVRSIVRQANEEYHAELELLGGGPGDPYLAFLYPTGDTFFSGQRHPRGTIVDATACGGHHLSPLGGSPWINAAVGVWSPSGSIAAEDVPNDSTGMKDFVLHQCGLA